MIYQKGVGLVEVLVSLLLLAIAVLGFTAMQLRAVTSSIESTNNVQATTLARDLGERMMINRAGFAEFKGSPNTTGNKDCNTTLCSAKDAALFDFATIARKAEANAMKVNIVECPNVQRVRQCILVAWENTEPTIGAVGTSACVQDNDAYVPGSNCIMIEAYNQ